MKAIRLYEYGGPEVLKYEEVETPKPRQGQVLVKVEGAGVNYADVARRRNAYLEDTPLPFTLGAEVAGTVVELGEGVTGMAIGERVTALTRKGGYAEYIALPAAIVFTVPRNIDSVRAAAIPLQGLTAYHTLKTSGRLKAGETVVVHAGAGGVGSLSIQLAKVMGAGKIIATASTQEKLDLALSLGADLGINYTEEHWPEKVLEATNGAGADLILETAGGRIFEQNFECLAPMGRVVVVGAASGQRGQIDSTRIMPKCQEVIGFYLGYLTTRPEIISPSMTELMNYVSSGRVKPQVHHTYPLAEAAEAHRQMETRHTTGKIVLIP